MRGEQRKVHPETDSTVSLMQLFAWEILRKPCEGDAKKKEKKEENQTKCELLIVRGVLVLKHFYVMRATALTFRKTSITIGYICKAAHFWFRCLSLLARWRMFFSYFQTVAYFWAHSEMDCSATSCSCWIPSFVTAKAEQWPPCHVISYAI